MHIKKKICLLGSYGVGKTSLVRRFVYNKFENKYLSTIGVNISKKVIDLKNNGQDVTLELFIWDIANIEKFDTVISAYLRGAEGAIIVTDISRPNTIENITEYIDKFLEINPNARIICVGNKIDLAEEIDFDKNDFGNKYQSIENDIIFTSAKTGHNIENIFNKFGESISREYVTVENLIDLLLLHKNIAFAIFNNSFELTQKSKNLSKTIGEKIDNLSNLYDIFPEFFGSEDLLAAILSGTSNDLRIERINKYHEKQKLTYLDYQALRLNKNDNKLLIIISNSTEKSELEQKIQQKNNEIKILKESIAFIKKDSITSILGESDEIKNVKKFIKKVANISSTTILLTGESGTGKTLVARGIHSSSDNYNSPFVEINCATIPAPLLESELFGHVKGAFTNALDTKRGLLEEANEGTLFLDEIGELPLPVQPKFLSFLESKRFRPVGSTKEIRVNTRIIAATNKDLKEAVKDKEFRDDLYYRINVLSLKIPSLNERRADIVLISKYFIKLFSNDFNRGVPRLTKEAEYKLLDYNWPGNIRELRNIIERAVIFCENDKIDSDDLIISELDIKKNIEHRFSIPEEGVSIIEIEKKYLENALKKAKGNQTKAAKLLNLSQDTFRYRIKKYNLLVQ